MMKVCVIQAPYDTNYNNGDEVFARFMSLIDECDNSLDIIVLPEYSDTPTVVKTKEEFLTSYQRYNHRIIEKATATAIRCHAIIFVNAVYNDNGKLRNCTYAIDRGGNLVGKYFKLHLAPAEFAAETASGRGFDDTYCDEYSQPYTVEIEGIKFGFLTCYDFYFYEYFARMAKESIDVIIGCSHQRSDLHSALETSAKYLCYQTNSYLLRASVSLGASAEVGGCSLIATPKGEIVGNLKNDVGLLIREIDITEKYYKPAGFGRPIAAHYEYIEEGRHPCQYRNGGSAIVRNDIRMPYPRVCAHHGFNKVAPENTLPAFGAAVALGAQEIEFDLWWTKDGELVSCHDCNLERISNGEGLVIDHTLQELQAYDFGFKADPSFRGLKITSFEDVLRKFSAHTIMNIHIETLDNSTPYHEDHLAKIVKLIDKYDCASHVYFMSGNDVFLKQVREKYPRIRLCVGAGDNPYGVVDRAIEIGAEKVQFLKPHFDQEMIDKAHANGVVCNVFWTDNEEEAKVFLKMGIDTILTNDYLKISNLAKQWTREKCKPSVAQHIAKTS